MTTDAPQLDPWQLQATIMRLSGQRVVNGDPQLTSTAILYAALTMEENAETIQAMLDVMKAHFAEAAHPELAKLMNVLTTSARGMVHYSECVRAILARLPANFSIDLKPQEAVALADGITDTTVTVMGLAAASGIPGRDCYAAVGESNLSKVDPRTGVIERDPSGKWIKGPNYRPPHLDQVLYPKTAGPELF